MTAAQERLAFVDNLRILLTVLVILHHLAITYGAPGGWYYREVEQPDTLSAVVLTLFVAVNQSFFMGFFFFLAGYFTPGSFERKGAAVFLKDRLLRLGVPLIVYMAVVSPILGYMTATFRYGFAGSFLDFVTVTMGRLRGLPVGPLWFVETLLIFAVFYALWRRIRPTTARVSIAPRRPGSGTIAGIGLGIGLASFFVRLWHPVGWVFEPLGLQFPFFPQYIGLYTLGAMASRQRWLTEVSETQGRGWRWTAVGIVALFPILFALGGGLEGNLEPYLGGQHWQAFAYACWEQLLCAAMIVGLTTLFRKRFDRQGQLSSAMASAAYTAYILHPLVLVSLGFILRGVGLPPLAKFALVGPVAVAATFAVSHLVRKLPLARAIL